MSEQSRHQLLLREDGRVSGPGEVGAKYCAIGVAREKIEQSGSRNPVSLAAFQIRTATLSLPKTPSERNSVHPSETLATNGSQV
jgi:hypothetical protein